MLKIAVTGGIACGKSRVAEYLADDGVRICDTDSVAHRLMSVGTPIYDRIVACFGRGVLGASGEINRVALGELVFGAPACREALNAIVHPGVKDEWTKWLREVDGPAAVVVPLLYEIGEGGGWDAVVCVACPEADQTARLKARGLSEAAARSRIAAQMPLAEKMMRADCVIFNCGTLELLREQTRRVWRSIVEK